VSAVPSDKRARQKAGRQERLEQERKAAKRRSQIRRGVIIGVIAVVVVGSVYLITKNHSSKSTTTTTTSAATSTTGANGSDAALQAKADAIAVAAGCPAKTSTRVNNLSWTSAPAMTIDTTKTYVATVVTTAGTFTINLDAAAAPQNVNNFVFLAQKGFYHCAIFHRVIPDFMDQTGDPTGTGTGGPGYTIADELPATASPQYPIGAVAMANTGAAHTGGSQFFIVTGPEGESLPNSYSLFGQVPSSSMAVPKLINQEGSTANNGVPPKVTQRILSIAISSS
jgi:cyclophilin family peptidyl-prolyl cis-trans isomerase